MRVEPKKIPWQDRAKEISKFHKLRLAADKDWTIKKTASVLDRSYGTVAESLLLASWMETHPRLERIKTAYEALRWIRNAKQSIRTRL
jgi:hypothetical protein